jgi:hypothetical protein
MMNSSTRKALSAAAQPGFFLGGCSVFDPWVRVALPRT